MEWVITMNSCSTQKSWKANDPGCAESQPLCTSSSSCAQERYSAFLQKATTKTMPNAALERQAQACHSRAPRGCRHATVIWGGEMLFSVHTGKLRYRWTLCPVSGKISDVGPHVFWDSLQHSQYSVWSQNYLMLFVSCWTDKKWAIALMMCFSHCWKHLSSKLNKSLFP